MIRRFITHTVIYGMANQIPKVAGILALPIITKDLTDRDYGLYGIILAYSAAIEILSTLGLRVSFQNTFYQKESKFKIYWSHLYGFLFSWRILYSLLHFFLIYFIMPADVDNKLLTAFLAMGASLFFGPISLVGSMYYQLNEKPAIVGVLSALSGIATVAFNIYFISYLKLGYLGWFWSTFATGMIVNSIYLFLVNYRIDIRPKLRFNIKFVKKALAVSLPTIPHFYSMFLLNFSDRIILNQYKVSTEDIGRYNVAYTVGNIFQSIAMASGFAIGPLMMRCYKSGDEHTARKLVFFLQGIFLLSTFLACVWMREIFVLLVKNDSLNQMYYLGIIIVMAFNYRPIYYGAVNKLIYLEKTKVLWRLSFVPGIINVCLNLLFIPFYGYEFAAISTFITFSLMGVLGYFQKEYREHQKINYFPIPWTLLNILLCSGAYVLKDSSVLVKFFITIAMLMACFLLTLQYRNVMRQLLNKKEISI